MQPAGGVTTLLTDLVPWLASPVAAPHDVALEPSGAPAVPLPEEPEAGGEHRAFGELLAGLLVSPAPPQVVTPGVPTAPTRATRGRSDPLPAHDAALLPEAAETTPRLCEVRIAVPREELEPKTTAEPVEAKESGDTGRARAPEIELPRSADRPAHPIKTPDAEITETVRPAARETIVVRPPTKAPDAPEAPPDVEARPIQRAPTPASPLRPKVDPAPVMIADAKGETESAVRTPALETAVHRGEPRTTSSTPVTRPALAETVPSESPRVSFEWTATDVSPKAPPRSNDPLPLRPMPTIDPPPEPRIADGAWRTGARAPLVDEPVAGQEAEPTIDPVSEPDPHTRPERARPDAPSRLRGRDGNDPGEVSAERHEAPRLVERFLDGARERIRTADHRPRLDVLDSSTAPAARREPEGELRDGRRHREPPRTERADAPPRREPVQPRPDPAALSRAASRPAAKPASAPQTEGTASPRVEPQAATRVGSGEIVVEAIRPSAMAEAIVARARQIDRGVVELRFALEPEDLGSVRVLLEARGDELKVRIVASSAAAADALGQGLSRLSAQLHDAGFRQPVIDLVLDDGGGSRQRRDEHAAERDPHPKPQPPLGILDPRGGARPTIDATSRLDRIA